MLYTSKAVLNMEQCSIGNQWRISVTGVMCEYLVVLVTILARFFGHIAAYEDQELRDS